MATKKLYEVFSCNTITGTKEVCSHGKCRNEEHAEQLAIAVGDMYGIGYYTDTETGEVLFYYEV